MPQLPPNSSIVPRLINGPFGDPGLYVGLPWTGRAFLFDAGHLERLPLSDLSRVTHLFISHTHVDHFIGFDRILRLLLARNASLCVVGPPGILNNVRGKLAGYTWNLVDGYDFAIDVLEVSQNEIIRTHLAAQRCFAMQQVGAEPFHGIVHRDVSFEVRAAHLDHRIPCLAYVLEEFPRLRVNKEALEAIRIPAGPWLNTLKQAIQRSASESDSDRGRQTCGSEALPDGWTMSELSDRLLEATVGAKIGYVVDVAFSEDNVQRFQAVANGLDVLFCEAPFLDADRHEALKRYHLTAWQAGQLARAVSARQLVVFHFSSRYDKRGNELYDEARDSFEARNGPDTVPPLDP